MEQISKLLDLLTLKLQFLFYQLNLYRFYYKRSYSQEGEDMVLSNIFTSNVGFYVDVGAHHPRRYSNTMFFYDRGWSGINIDPNPGIMKLFRQSRPNDINLEIGIGRNEEKKKYYCFNEPALNGFDRELSLKRIVLKEYKLIGEMEVEVKPLSSVLDTYLPKDTIIDFFNIDTEGLDYEVLKSNNWEKYSPKCILVEIQNMTVDNLWNNNVYKFLSSLGYTFYAKTGNTCVLIRKKFLHEILEDV